MLEVYVGSDEISIRKKAGKRIDILKKKRHNLLRIDTQQFEKGMITNTLEANSLFGEKQIVVIDTPSENSEMFEESMGHLKEMSESSHTYICIEGVLRAPEKKKLEKYAAVFEEIEGKKIERFNTFSLADSLLEKDKKQLWMRYIAAKKEGVSPEEIIGTLLWQVKILRLAYKSKDAKEAGLKPFVYSKAKSATKKFSEEETDRLSRELVEIYHEGHVGKRDIDAALEAWMLKK